MSKLLANPEHLAAWRKILFYLDEPITLTTEEFNTYWPYVDNIWSYKSKNRPRKDGSYSIYYFCRFYRKTWDPKEPSGERLVQKTIREGAQCDCRMNITVYVNGTRILKRHDDQTHSHDIDASDSIKKNSGLRERVTGETESGYEPAVVLHAFRGTAQLEGRVPLEEAGGRFLNQKDVNNYARGYHGANPDIQLQGNTNP